MGDLLIVGSCNGMIRALDRKNGRVAWDYDIRKDGDQRQFHGEPAIADRILIIGADRNIGHVCAFDTSTGDVRWKYKVEDGGVASDIVRLGRNVYAVTLGDNLLSLDLESGKLNWMFHSNFSGHDFHWMPPAAVSAGRVYFGGQDGVLYALDSQSGKLIWKRALDSPISTSIAVHGNDLYLGTAKEHLYRVDSNSGDVTGDLKTEWEPRRNLVEGENSLLMFLGDELLASVDLSLKK